MANVGTAWVLVRMITQQMEGDLRRGVERAARRTEPAIRQAARQMGRRFGEQFATAAQRQAFGERVGRRIAESIGKGISSIRLLPFLVALLIPALGGIVKLAAAYVGELVSLFSGLGPAIAGSLVAGVSGITLMIQGIAALGLAFSAETDRLETFKAGMTELGEVFTTIGQAVQSVLLEPLLANLQRMTVAVLGPLRDGLVGTGREVAALSGELADLTENEVFQSNFATTINGNNVSLRNFGRALINIVDSAITLAAAGQPLLQFFTRYVDEVTAGWSAQLRMAQSTGNLTAYLDRSQQVLQQLGRIGENVRITLSNMFSAASEQGQGLLFRIEALTARWREWTGSIEGQNQLERYFENSSAIATEFNRLVGDIFRALGQSIQQNPQGLINFIQVLRTQALPAFVRLAGALAQLGPGFIDLTVAVSDFVTALAGSGAMGAFVDTLNVIFSTMRSLLELPVAGEVLGWALAFAAIGRAINLVTFGAFTKAIAAVGTAIGGMIMRFGEARLGAQRMATVVGGLSAAAGPLGLAVAGLTLGLGFLAMKHQEAAQKAQEQALAAQELVDTLDNTTGALTEQSEQWAINEASTNGYLTMARDLDTVMRDWGVSERDIIDALQGKEDAVNRVTAAIDAEQGSTRKGIVNGKDYRDSLSNLEGQIRTNAEALEVYRQSLEDVSRLSQEAQDTQALADAITVLRDAAADADTKLRAYNEALELLNGGTVDVDRANRELYQTFRAVDEAFVNTSASAAAGSTVFYDLTGAISSATGQLDQTTEIGGIVADTYDRMREQADRAALAIAQSGGTAQEVQAPYAALRQEFVDLLTTAGATPAEIDAIVSSLDTVPDETKAELLLGAEGFNDPMEAAQGLMNDMDGRQALAQIVGNNQPLIDKIMDSRTDLDSLSQVVATATADLDPTEANRVYQEVLFLLTGLDEQHPTPTAHLDPAAFDAALAIVDAQIATLASLTPTPEVRANLADWQRKREIVLQNIDDLDAERPTPTVDANPNPFYTHSANAQQRINTLNAQRPTPVISANPNPFYGVATGVAGRLATVNATRATPTVAAQDQSTGLLGRISAMLAALRSKTITVTTQHVTKGNTMMAAGGVVQAAAGRFRDAMIAKGGSNILWAEPETGWEAYIPGRQDKRGRALGILEEVANRFGKAIVPMAEGGFPTRDPGTSRGPIAVRPSNALPPTIINNFMIDQALIPFEARKYAAEVVKQQRRDRSIRPKFTM